MVQINCLPETSAILGGLYGDGMIGQPGAFSTSWADRMAADIWIAFDQAKAAPGGLMPRGPQRYYVGVQPEKISGFVDIVTHPWFETVCEAVLGAGYKVVEIGFDLPFPGAVDQPWHRDFAGPTAKTAGRLTSLAFNLTGIDTRPEHGPFEIAPGTQWDTLDDAPGGMFPARAQWARFSERAVRKMAQRGDFSARSGLTVHRGTANRSNEARPVLIVGVVSAEVVNRDHHQLQVTQTWVDSVSPTVRERLLYQVVPDAAPIVQQHAIEGLLADAA